MSYNLFGTKISETYQNLLQITSGNTIVNGTGSTVDINVGTFLYNNNESGLSATNPQDAIDELVTMINLSGGSLTPVHNTENTAYNITYTGFGTTGATSIMKVISYSANTYDVLWAEGNKIQNKNWNDRFTYSYSAIT